MWNKKEDKTVLGQGLLKGLKEAVEAEIPKEGKELTGNPVGGEVDVVPANVVVVEKEELKKSYPENNELADVLAKALNDSLGFLPAGGSVRSTVDKALAKYNASKA